MKFEKFNKNTEKLFTFNCNEIQGIYHNSKEMFELDGKKEVVHVVKGVYINRYSQYDPEAPTLALEDTYVNLPQHQLAEIKEMRADAGAIKQINNGELGVSFYSYVKELERPDGTKVKKRFYAAKWHDIAPMYDWDEDDEDIITDDDEE